MPVWEAVAASSLFGVDVELRPRTRLVGRIRELDQLLGALARARAEREPQLVTIVGVPGMGKSRLVQELSAAIEREPELIRWRQGRSLPYGQGVSYWALGEMVKASRGSSRATPADVAEAKLARGRRPRLRRPRRRLDRLDAATADRRRRGQRRLRPARRGLRRLAAVPRRARRRAAERARVRGPALGRRGLLDFVDGLVDWATDVPLLVVATARPELLARRRALGRREAKRDNVVARAALGVRDGRARACGARARGAPGRRAGGGAGSRRREPALRRGVRPPRGRARLRSRRRPAGTRLAPGPHRRPARRADAEREGAAPGRSRPRQGVLARCARRGRAPSGRSTTPCARSNGRSSCVATGDRRSRPRSNTRSGTSLVRESRTRRSRAPRARSGTSAQLRGSRRASAPRTCRAARPPLPERARVRPGGRRRGLRARKSGRAGRCATPPGGQSHSTPTRTRRDSTRTRSR